MSSMSCSLVASCCLHISLSCCSCLIIGSYACTLKYMSLVRDLFCHGGGSLTAGRRVMPALAGVFVTFASTAITAHRTHVMDCYASHSVQVLILPLRRTPVGVPETASNDLAMSLAGIGESSKAIMISNRAERIERALVGDKAFRRSLLLPYLIGASASHCAVCVQIAMLGSQHA